MASGQLQNYRDFWPFYLGEHRDPTNRALHLSGTTLGLALLLVAVVTGTWWLAILALLCGYGFAWIGHMAFERNKPATFSYPLWSLISDFRMWYCWITGRLGRELAAHDIVSGQ